MKQQFTVFELPCLDNRKSFYGKAHIIETLHGVYLCSYDTIVCGYDRYTGDFYRYWDGYSATTLRHVNSFRRFYRNCELSKKEWEGMAVIEW